MSKQYQEEDATYFDEPLVYEMIKDLVEYDLEHITINEIIELATDQLYANYRKMPYENLKETYTKLFDR
jgi:hypothetical protein